MSIQARSTAGGTAGKAPGAAHPKSLSSPRITVSTFASEPGSSGGNGNTRRGRVVKAILHSIFAGELVGGDRLVEEELAVRLGVSRTPIREALSELCALGVIWLKPNHGAMVRPFGPRQIRDIYQIRRVLEMEAARAAAEHIDHAQLREIREKMQQFRAAPDHDHTPAWSDDALSQDQRLHELIARSSGSERLAEEIHRYWTLALTIGEAVGNASHTQDRALVEHTAIIDCLLAGDGDGAAEAMRAHVDGRLDAALDALTPALKQR